MIQILVFLFGIIYQKRDNQQIESEPSDKILNFNKKEKKSSRKEELLIEMNCQILQNAIALK